MRPLVALVAIIGAALFLATVAVYPLRSFAVVDPSPALPGAVSSSIEDFGFRLLGTLTDGKGGNVIISPLSVSVALAMTYNGASDDTKTAMAKTLGLSSMSDESINVGIRGLLDNVRHADPAVQIEIADALWPQSGFPIKPDFLKLTRDLFDAPVETLDFDADPDQATNRINSWVNEKTHGKISEIVQKLDRSTVLVLTNAVYFKGRWATPFDKKKTAPQKFYPPANEAIMAPMMDGSGNYSYFETDSFQAVRLPYGKDRFAMYVFLPTARDGLPDFLHSLDETNWIRWMAGFSSQSGHIVLPKLDSTYGRSLNAPLKAMGIAIALGPGADFSSIHPPPPHLQIDDVEHKTYVKVDEEGTEAAAATSVTVGFAMVMSPFRMTVDHPYFFAITDKESSAMLFAGVVTNPAQH